MPPRKKRPYVYPAHLRNSRPRLAHCDRCKLQILSATYDALPVILDPQPLSMIGELDALASRNRTWLIAAGTLWKRTAWAIKTSPRGFGGTVHRTHQCHRGHPRGALVKPPESPLKGSCPF